MHHHLERFGLPTGLALIASSSAAQWAQLHALDALHVGAILVGTACTLATTWTRVVDTIDRRAERKSRG